MTLDGATSERFANIVLDCVHRQYPNKIAHVLHSDGDVRPPREITPAFYGCFDWHSAVHGHWTLARLSRLFPDGSFVGSARDAFEQNMTGDNIAREVEYISQREGFERPYGLAWLLQLSTELRRWDGAAAWSAALAPLEALAAAHMERWLRTLPRPIRTGEHNQSAFGLSLFLDWAEADAGSLEVANRIRRWAMQHFASDEDAPLRYEPSGYDFFSPALAEADCVRRILDATQFASWLSHFLPGIPTDGASSWLLPMVSPDPSDGKLAHLDGLSLSRAWMLEGIARGLPDTDARIAALRACSQIHLDAGLAAVTAEHYAGSHWLATFAVYGLTE